MVHVRGPEETWAKGDPGAERETLAVLPERRGGGVGAVRFYERLGLTRFLVTYAGPVTGT